MRKIIAITQVTVDGVMQGPGGPEEDPRNGFSQGGWAMPYGDETLHKVISETINSPFDMLLGRHTYEIFADYWPKHDDDPIGRAFNRAKKYVATNTITPDWQPSEAISGDVIVGICQLKATDGPDIHVWGSGVLLQAMMAAGLIDEHRLWVAPVVLGEGKKLFENGLPPQGLSLVATAVTSTGVLINTYRPDGLPKKAE
jgi:dihydrofolate reductase